MADAEEEKTRKMLEESVQKISQVPAGREEGGVTAFRELSTGVNRAKKHDVQGLLGPLEPKAHVLGFLAGLHEKKRMYSKQVQGVFATLVQVDSWRQAARLQAGADLLPADLRQILDDVPVPPPPAPEPSAPAVPASPPPAPEPSGAPEPAVAPSVTPAPAPTAAGQADEPGAAAVGVPTDTQIRRACEAGLRRIGGMGDDEQDYEEEMERRKHELEGDISYHLALFSEAAAMIEGLGYSAANDDKAVDAFDKLRIAISKITSSKSTEDDKVLEDFVSKGELLKFLDDYADRRKMSRGRVSSVKKQLWDTDGWRAVLSAAGWSADSPHDDAPVDFSPPPRGPAPATAPAAAPPAAAPRGVAAAPERWVWWGSVDPFKGWLRPYPQESAKRLERAYSDGQDSLDLGADFFNALVHFKDGGHSALIQKTSKGSRDVCRVELSSADAEVAVLIYKHPDATIGWRKSREGYHAGERRTARKEDVAPNAVRIPL